MYSTHDTIEGGKKENTHNNMSSLKQQQHQSIDCAACGTRVPCDKADMCSYCHKVGYCSDACEATGFTDHQFECNAILTPAEHVLPAVPSAWQNMASEAQWKTQKEPFPAYLAQYRNANGALLQTVFPAVAAPAPLPSAQDQEALRQVREHSFDLQVELLHGPHVDAQSVGRVVYTDLIAPDHMIHVNSSLPKAINQAKTRTSPGIGQTYWVGKHVMAESLQKDGQPFLKVLDLPGNDNQTASSTLKVTLTPDYRQDAPVSIECTLVPMDHFNEQVRSKLGHHLRQHLQMQYKHKGLGSGKDLATYMGINQDTGARTILTFDRSQPAATCLVDVEVFVPLKGDHPVKFQKEQFEHALDIYDTQDVEALIEGIGERVAELESMVETRQKTNDDPDNEHLLGLKSRIHELCEHKATLEKHVKALDVCKKDNVPLEGVSTHVSAAVNQSMQTLWEPIEARAQAFFDEMFSRATWHTDADETVNGLGMALVKRRDEYRKLMNEASRRRGRGRMGAARLRAKYVRRRIKDKEKEMRKLISAASVKKNQIYNTLSRAGMSDDDIAASEDYTNIDSLMFYATNILDGTYQGSIEDYRNTIYNDRIRMQGKEGGLQERGRAWVQRGKEKFGEFKEKFSRTAEQAVSWPGDNGSGQQSRSTVDPTYQVDYEYTDDYSYYH